MRRIVWFSCGAASSIVARIVLKKYPAQLVYCDTGGEHPDNKRFLTDIEKWLNTKVVILKNPKYKDHFELFEKVKYLNGIYGARCTVELKKEMRYQFQQPDDIQYFGYTFEERHRAERLVKAYPEINAKFPLIDKRLTKEDCIGLLLKNNIEIPTMYKLGFRNNNCIPCVKGGAGYFNLIKKHFPEQFDRLAKIERTIGASCGKKYLDELKDTDGNHNEPNINCDFVCQSLDL